MSEHMASGNGPTGALFSAPPRQKARRARQSSERLLTFQVPGLSRLIWKARQWWFRRLMLRDATLAEIQRHITQARKAHAPVNHLRKMYFERVNQILGGGL